MKVRSPVLGYNHNVRYAGRLWHVQTEDSGVNNPHIFTHLFHDGTILATKRADYDPASEVVAVQKLMQQQHKALLRELKAGVFDEKITKFFGEPVKRENEETTDPTGKSPLIELTAEPDDEAPRTDPTLRPIEPPPEADEPAPPPPAVEAPIGHAATQLAIPTPQPMPRVATPAPMPQVTRPAARPGTATNIPREAPGIGARRAAAAQTGARPVEGVVVARPAVIIGGEQGRGAPTAPAARAPGAPVGNKRWQQAPEPPPAPEPEPKPAASDNIFGGDLISEKSLDEVILAYLSEDLNDK
jgi:hypothetical protein